MNLRKYVVRFDWNFDQGSPPVQTPLYAISQPNRGQTHIRQDVKPILGKCAADIAVSAFDWHAGNPWFVRAEMLDE